MAQVRRAAQLSPDEVIERVHVAVGPELRGEVPNGQAARTAGGQQVVSGEPEHFIFLIENPVAAGDDSGGEVEDARVGDVPAENLQQHTVIDGGEVLDDVEPQRVTVKRGELLKTVYRAW